MLLSHKVAVIYGATGAIGGAIAHAFAREGARVFVTGRRRAAVHALAKEITAGGGSADAGEVDALDEGAIDRHLAAVADTAGRVDISVNAIGVPDAEILGVPFVEMSVDQLVKPIADYTRSYFLTARAAAKRMIATKSGVIMTLSAFPARRGTALNGGYGAAQAAKEQLTRDLSFELARHGIRVVGLCPHGLPETAAMRQIFDLKANASGMTWEQFEGYLASMTHARRAMTVAEVANTAAFVASDSASAITGTTLNLTMGGLDS